MRDFAFHLNDDRHADPVVRLAKVRDAQAAHTLAERMLLESYHHRAVEVWESGERLYKLENAGVY